jgi:hypothetical protein
MTTDNTTPEEAFPEATEEIIYQQERLGPKLLKGFLIFLGILVALVVALLLIGFITVLAGGRPPTLDPNILDSQLDRIFGGNSPTPTPSLTPDLGELTPIP